METILQSAWPLTRFPIRCWNDHGNMVNIICPTHSFKNVMTLVTSKLTGRSQFLWITNVEFVAVSFAFYTWRSLNQVLTAQRFALLNHSASNYLLRPFYEALETIRVELA